MPDRVEVTAVRNGGRDHIEVPTATEAAIAALQRERAGYVMRDLPARIAAVDAELRRLGATPTVHTGTPETGARNDDSEQGRRRTRRPATGRAGRAGAAKGQ